MLAAHTLLPVIGLPVKSSMMDGLDSLLSTVQMPAGIPVATVGVSGGENAGLLVLRILALKYPDIAKKLEAHKAEMREKILKDDESLRSI